MTRPVSFSSLSSLTFEQLLADVGSPEPTPGGGSVSALAGALGSALVSMVAGLAARREHAAQAGEMRHAQERADELQRLLVELADADAEAYQRVIAASRMPRTRPEEASARADAIQTSLRAACETPMQIAARCVEALQLAHLAVAYASRDVTSDALTGALLARAALYAAVLSVRTNLRSISDESFRAAAAARLDELVLTGDTAFAGAQAAAERGE